MVAQKRRLFIQLCVASGFLPIVVQASASGSQVVGKDARVVPCS
jgi:hypothetical protein